MTKENVTMNEDGIFWVNVWRTVGAVIVALAVIIAVFHHNNNERRTKAWIACVEANGQPLSQPMVGTGAITFTCVRK